MNSTAKILTGTAIGAGVIALFSYFGKMRRAQVELEVIPQAFIHSVSLDGLVIKVNAILKNPTGASFSIKFPFIKVSHKDVVLGSSQVVDKDIKISAYGQVLIDSMMVQVPVLSFFSTGYDVVKALGNKEPVSLLVKIITTIDLGWSKVPYEFAKEIVLKK